MRKFFTKKARKIASIIYLFSLLFQNVAPLAFIATTAYANNEGQSTVESVDPSSVSLGYDQEAHSFSLEIKSSEDREFSLESNHLSVETGQEVTTGVTGLAKSQDGIAKTEFDSGACSGEDCISVEITHGKLTLTGTDYSASFEVKDGQTWLRNDKLSTITNLELDKTYTAPQNDKVQVTFTKLSENPGSLFIEEVELSDEQVQALGAYSKVAYDISSDMPNGSFEYDLKLPLPEGADENSQVKFAESVEELDSSELVGEVEGVMEGDVMKVGKLDHFTVFVVVYNSQPLMMPGSYPSLGFQATQTSEFGDHLQLAGTERIAQRISVELTNWACENDFTSDGSGGWITSRGNADACVTSPGSSYIHPITLNVYQVDSSGIVPAVGALIVSKTVDATIPFRPSYDGNPLCESPSADQPFGGTWYDDVTNSCVHGYNFEVPFDLSGEVLPDEIIVAVAYNTQSYGSAPIGASGPYNSLNVAVGNVVPSVGINVDPDDVFWNTSTAGWYTDGGAGGVGILRQDTAWTDYVPVIKVETVAPSITTIEIPKDNISWMFNRDLETASPYEFNSDYSSIGVGSLYAMPIANTYPVATKEGNDKFIAEDFIMSPIADIDEITYDYMIGPGGASSDANHFYMSVYANFGESSTDKYYDCRYSVVPTIGSTSDFTTVTFDTSLAYPVVTRTGSSASPYTCPAIPADMDSLSPGSTIRVYALNMGDTSMNDTGLDGYFDNVVVDKGSEVTVYDFEPDTTSPAKPTWGTIYKGHNTDAQNDIGCDSITNTPEVTFQWNKNTETDLKGYWFGTKFNSKHQWFDVGSNVKMANMTPGNNPYYYTIIAVDNAGNESEISDQCGLTLDQEAPEAPTLIEPLNNSIVNGAVLLSDWTTVGDAHHYIYESYHDAGATNLRWNAEYTDSEKTANNVGEATFWWRVKAVDVAGNESSWSELWKVTVDNTAPSTPTNLHRLGADASTYQCFEFSIRQNMVPMWDTNGESDFDHYEYSSFNAGGTQGLDEKVLYTNSLANTWIAPVDGTYGFAVRAVDKAGNKSPWALSNETLAGSCQISYDSQAPSAPEMNGFLNPALACGSITNIHSTTVDWTDSIDSGSGFDKYEYFIDYPLPGGGRGTWTTNLSSSQYGGVLNEGTHNIKVRAKDAVGNTSEWSNICSITTDWTAPDVEITNPSAGIVSGVVDLRGTVTDDNPHHYWLVIQNSSNATVVGPGVVNETISFTDQSLLSWDTTTLPDGVYTIKLEARDAANNKDSGSSHWLGVTVDNNLPTSTITNPDVADEGQTETNEFTGLIEGTAEDGTGSGIDHVLLSVSHLNFGADEANTEYWDATGSAWVNTLNTFRANWDDGTQTWDYQLPDVPEGIYNITSHAVDNAGNVETTYTIKIVYDKTIPEVNLTINPTSPDGDSGWYVTKPTITLEDTDNYMTDYIEYRWNSGGWETYVAPIQPPAEGQNILYYRGVDKVGNFATESTDIGVKEVKYDETSPAEGPLNVRVENIGIDRADGKWNKPANVDNITRYVLSWRHEASGDSKGTSVGPDDFEEQLTGLYDGDWIFTVKAMDDAGNFKEGNTRFRVGSSGGGGGTTSTEGGGEVLGTTTEDENVGVGGVVAGAFATNQAVAGEEEAENQEEQEEETATEEVGSQGEILGESTQACSGWKLYLPLILLVLQALAIGLYELMNREKKTNKIITTFVATVVAIGIFLLLRDKACSDGSTILAVISKWFVLESIIVAALMKTLSYAFIEEV